MTDPIVIEKQLHKRLKWIGILLFAFALITIIWDFVPSVEDEMDELLLEIEEAPPSINPYLISTIFTIMGSTCLFIYWKKKSILKHNS